MDNFFQWFASSPIASALRVFVAVVVFQGLTDIVELGHFDFSNWETWLIAGLASSLPTLLRWVNPEDKAFGVK